jgi:hypothetical protein
MERKKVNRGFKKFLILAHYSTIRAAQALAPRANIPLFHERGRK